jgi:hypothetical protein
VQPLLQWKSCKCYSVSFCSLRYPACYGHALYCHLWPATLYNIFPHYLTKHTIWKKILNMKYVYMIRVSLQIVSETFLILRRIKGNIIINARSSSCEVTVIPVRLWWNLKFLDRLCKNNFIKLRSVGADLVHADGWTERRRVMAKLMVAFRNFTNVPKYYAVCPHTMLILSCSIRLGLPYVLIFSNMSSFSRLKLPSGRNL